MPLKSSPRSSRGTRDQLASAKTSRSCTNRGAGTRAAGNDRAIREQFGGGGPGRIEHLRVGPERDQAMIAAVEDDGDPVGLREPHSASACTAASASGKESDSVHLRDGGCGACTACSAISLFAVFSRGPSTRILNGSTVNLKSVAASSPEFLPAVHRLGRRLSQPDSSVAERRARTETGIPFETQRPKNAGQVEDRYEAKTWRPRPDASVVGNDLSRGRSPVKRIDLSTEEDSDTDGNAEIHGMAEKAGDCRFHISRCYHYP